MNSLTFSTNPECTETTKIAYSYIRWSTAIQGSGDSYRRQKHKAEQWCDKNGFTLADDRIMLDAGVSAFKGKNISDGALGAFMTAAKEGKFPKGSYLLVESIDRMSRQGMMKIGGIVQDIWSAGISIVTLIDDKTYHPDCDDMDALVLLLTAMRAKEESVTKGKRVKDSYVKRNARAAETGVLPSGNTFGWLAKDPATGKAVLADERKPEIVRRIFDMSLNGCGLPKIAKTLNEAGERPFAMDKKTKGRAEYWTIANVAHILKSKAVYGDYHRKNAEPMIGIFPVVVSKEDYYRAQAGMASRQRTGKGRKGPAYTNLFGGIAKCHHCGEPMTIRNPKRGRATQFYCKGTLVGSCHARPWSYKVFEEAFLSFVNEIDMQTIIHGGTASRADEITQELQTLQGEKLNHMKVEESYFSAIEKNPDIEPIYQGRVLINRQKLDTIREQIKSLENERHQIQLEQRVSSETNTINFPTDISTEALYELRAKAAEHIRTLVERVTLIRDVSSKFGASFTVTFKGGGSRMVHVDCTNPRKAFAVTHVDSDKPDSFPSDSETAVGLLNHVVQHVGRELEWLVANGDEADREAIDGMIGELQSVGQLDRDTFLTAANESAIL